MLLSFIAAAAAAQPVTLRGRVYSSIDREPLIGAIILVKDTSNGTGSGIDGEYSLECNYGDELHISYLGYDPQYWIVSSPQKDFYLDEIPPALEWTLFKSTNRHTLSASFTISTRSGEPGVMVKYRFSPFFDTFPNEYGFRPPRDRFRRFFFFYGLRI